MASTTSLGFPVVDNVGSDSSMLVQDYLNLITGSGDESVVSVAEAELLKRANKNAKTSVEWAADTSTVIAAGEFGYATDTKQIKFGDGISLWKDLPEYKSSSDVIKCFTTSGDGTNYTVTVPSITALTNGISFYIKFHTVSESTAPFLNVNGLGEKRIFRLEGGSLDTRGGDADDWISDSISYRIVFDGSAWILVELSLPTTIVKNIMDGSSPYSLKTARATDASGSYSFAGGLETTASGRASFSEGFRTTAAGEYQHVQGQYNIPDVDSKYAHIVGNGYVDQTTFVRKESNAHTIDWEGVGWFAGGLKVGGTSQDDGEEVALKSDLEGLTGSINDNDVLAVLIEADSLPAITSTAGAILTDSNGNIVLRY